jgi:hypothetical protein
MPDCICGIAIAAFDDGIGFSELVETGENLV